MTSLLPRDDPTRRCLRVTEWPIRDQARWRAALYKGKHLVDPPGVGAKWAKSTVEKHRKGYGRWLCFAAANGLIKLDGNPGARVTPDAVEAYFVELNAQVAPYTVRGRMFELYHVIRAMCPEGDWGWLKYTLRRINAQELVGRNKRSRMIRAGDILVWTAQEIDAIIAIGRPTANRSVRMRDALLLAAFLGCPLRRGNMASIEIGRQLTRHEDGYQIAFEAHEMKNRVSFEMHFPDWLTPWMDAWIERYRPVLLRDKFTDRLWIARTGTPMTDMAVYHRIVATTKRAFDRPINPHLLRDIAATTIALQAPEWVRITRDILGHNNHRTGERYYNQARTVEASRVYNQVLHKMRRCGPPPEAYTDEIPRG